MFSLWPGALQVTKQIPKNSFTSSALFDQVWWYNMKQFLSYSKKYICKFIQANSLHHKLFHFHFSFGSVDRKGKITKIWLSQELKELFRWNKQKL